jgi:hypothetical protein
MQWNLPTEEDAMHETYRMLGREHEADLEREASRRALKALLPARAPLRTQIAESVRRLVLDLRMRMPRPRRARAVPSRQSGAP